MLRVAAPTWWMPAAVVVAGIIVYYFWTHQDLQHYSPRLVKRVRRGTASVVGLALIVLYLANTAMVEIRGDRIRVRNEFQRAIRSYGVDDLSHYYFSGVTGRSGRGHHDVRLSFRDGFYADICPNYPNYDELIAWLESQPVEHRRQSGS